MGLTLGFNERRVLGTLIEKAFTTPQQCPLTLNSLVNGCNQKSCRDPMSYLDESEIFDALENLREAGFAVLVRSSGSQVDRWKQKVGEALELESREVAVLAELLLRGPQTDGEIRQRASRMVKIGSLDDVGEALNALASHDPPLAACLTPGRKRGVKYGHTLYPEGEAPEIEESSAETPAAPRRTAAASPAVAEKLEALEETVDGLRRELAELTERVARLEGG